MTWTHNNEPITEIPEGHMGFVYLIENKITGRKYIGKKIFHFSKTSTKTVTLKNGTKKKKKIKSKIPSDWLTYWGSSVELTKDILELGVDNFSREILHYCNSKAECSYVEAKLQFEFEVLLYPEKWYNGQIQCRLHRSHIKNFVK
jgi:hypothetical protein